MQDSSDFTGVFKIDNPRVTLWTNCWCYFQYRQIRAYAQVRHGLLATQNLEQRIKIPGYFVAGGLKCRNLAAGVQDRCMVASAEGVADVRQTQMRQLLGEGHRDLAGTRNVSAALFRAKGRVPVNISTNRQPNEKISLGASALSPRTCSGDI